MEGNNNNKVLYVIITILVLIVAGLLVYIFVFKDKKEDTKDDKTTTTTTTQATSTLTEKSFVVEDITGATPDYKNVNYYANNFYLIDGKLYAVPSAKNNLTLTQESIDKDGKKAYLLKDNVKDLLLLKQYEEPKNTDVIVLTNDGKTYYLMNNPKNVGTTHFGTYKGLELIEISNATNVVKGYELDSAYYLVNNKNQIVYNSFNGPVVNFDAAGEYVCYDNTNKIGTNILRNGEILEISIKGDTANSDTLDYKINGVSVGTVKLGQASSCMPFSKSGNSYEIGD